MAWLLRHTAKYACHGQPADGKRQFQFVQQAGDYPGSLPNQQVMQATGVPIVRSEGGQIKYMQPVMMIVTPVINVHVPGPSGMAQVTTAPTSSVGACAAATAGAATVVSGLASTAPSKGSQLHGQITEDGQRACQPCAWFHKAFGCQNGASCGRCHLCPEGELKLRRKQKLAKLRNAEVAGVPVVSVPISPASESADEASAAALSSYVGFTHGHKIISPHWTNIHPDEEEGHKRPQQGQSQPARQSQGMCHDQLVCEEGA